MTPFACLARLKPSWRKMPDGATFLTVARTVAPVAGGYRRQRPFLAVAVGCEVSHARHVVYADGKDLKSQSATTPIGVSCRAIGVDANFERFQATGSIASIRTGAVPCLS